MKGGEGNLNFVLVASMAAGTQQFVRVGSCSIPSSICNKQDAAPFWWGCHMTRRIAPWLSSKKPRMAKANVITQGGLAKHNSLVAYKHAWAQRATQAIRRRLFISTGNCGHKAKRETNCAGSCH